MSKSFKGVPRETKLALKKQDKAIYGQRKTKSIRWIPSSN